MTPLGWRWWLGKVRTGCCLGFAVGAFAYGCLSLLEADWQGAGGGVLFSFGMLNLAGVSYRMESAS